MPLTSFQRDVLRVLASHRNPESHVGGGSVLNRADDSPRYSEDIDLFHDVAQSVISSAEADCAALLQQGFTFAWLLRQPSLQRAQVSRGSEGLRLDWCSDSAFRFFPVQPDPEFGYCLHKADLATNKMLALANRSEFRDYVDILHLHKSYLTLGAMCWAACGKDQGFTPWTIIEFAKRNVNFRNEVLASGHFREPITLPALKEEWLKAVAEAEDWFARLPATDVGCLYLSSDTLPFTPDPSDPRFASLTRHYGIVRGAWPTLS